MFLFNVSSVNDKMTEDIASLIFSFFRWTHKVQIDIITVLNIGIFITQNEIINVNHINELENQNMFSRFTQIYRYLW